MSQISEINSINENPKQKIRPHVLSKWNQLHQRTPTEADPAFHVNPHKTPRTQRDQKNGKNIHLIDTSIALIVV